MAVLSIQILGSPRIAVDGRPIEVDTRKATALLAYLAVTGQPQSRDVLAALLWEEYDDASARAALRRTLSSLKAALHDAWLQVDRQAVGIASGTGVAEKERGRQRGVAPLRGAARDPATLDDGADRAVKSEELSIDVVAFQRLLDEVRRHGDVGGPCAACLARLEDAVTLYRDDFMAGFSLRDSERFEAWQRETGEALRGALAGALTTLTDAYSGLGRVEEAIAAARRRLHLDSLDESAHRSLMRLYAESGRRSEALVQYRECVAVLERELAVAPLEETTALYRSIKERRAVTSAPPHRAAETPKAPGLLPLVGREGERAALREVYVASTDSGRLAVLEGEAGIGKTRLLEDFLGDVRADGGTALAARCYEGEAHLAYTPFLDVLRTAVGRLRGSPAVLTEAARLLPEIAVERTGLPQAAPLDSPGAQSRFLGALCDVILAALRGERPGVLAVDDLHWADSDSLDLLAALMRRLPENPVCLLLTWRGEQMPAGHWLRRRVSDLARTGTVAVIRPARLDRTAIGELVAAVTKEQRSELGTRLFSETEGLPLFLHAYLSTLDGEAPGGTWSVPATVSDLLHARLAHTSDIGRQVLGAGAAIGRSFDFATVRAASGRDEEMVVEALEELIAAGLIAEIDGGSAPAYDFNHEKLRNLVYEETSLARRRLLHRRIAEALLARSVDRDADAGKIAQHYRLAGGDTEAAEFSWRAGQHARSLFANTVALQHFETALALGYPNPPAVHEATGDVQTLLGEYPEAIRAYETAAALLGGTDLARIEHKLGLVYGRYGEWGSAESFLESAIESTRGGDDPATLARLYADRSLVAHQQGLGPVAQVLAEQALALAEEAGDNGALAQTHNILGILANARGDAVEARTHLAQSLAFAERLGDLSMRAAASNNLALAARTNGDLAEARELTESALALAIAQGDRHREAALHNNLADLLHASGHPTEAVSHVKAAVTIYAEIGVEGETVLPEIWKLTEW